MNCKPGDLAIVVKSWAGNEGRVVRCIKLLGDVRWFENSIDGGEYLPTWEIDIELPNMAGHKANNIADNQLRPIRDPGDDAQDETLSWKRVPFSPHKEVA